jgi:hypothetical protein
MNIYIYIYIHFYIYTYLYIYIRMHILHVHIQGEKRIAQITAAHERDTVEIRAAFLGRPPSAGQPRHWMRTNYTHACANQEN